MRGDRIVPGACILLGLPSAVWPSTLGAGATYQAGLLLIVVGLWVGARRCTGPARRGWRLVALTTTFWFAGDLLQRINEAIDDVPRTATWSDPIWLSSYPILAAAVVVWFRGRGLSRAVVREILLDTSVITAVAVAVCWRLMIFPALPATGFDSAALVDLLYPVGDVVVICLAMLLVLAPGARRLPTVLVITCLALTFGMDCLFSVQQEQWPGLDPERLDGVALVVNSLLAWAALDPRAGELAEPEPEQDAHLLHRWRIVLLGAALIIMCTVESLPAPGGALDRTVLGMVAAVMSVSIVVRFYVVVREREGAQAALLHQAGHDQLTGLANRSRLLAALDAALRVPDEARGSGLCLLYFDLDGFKDVNDTWGHAAGDVVLRAVAERLVAVARPGDTVARIGGDEFVLLRPGTSREEARDLATRLLRVVSTDIPLGEGIAGGLARARIGTSIGVLTLGREAAAGDATRSGGYGPPDPYSWPVPGGAAGALDADALLRGADEAMYAAKSGGGGLRIAHLSGWPAAVPGGPSPQPSASPWYSPSPPVTAHRAR